MTTLIVGRSISAIEIPITFPVSLSRARSCRNHWPSLQHSWHRLLLLQLLVAWWLQRLLTVLLLNLILVLSRHRR